MKTSLLRLFVVTSLLLTAVPVTHAQDLRAIRDQMERRVSQIDALKTKGILGENNRGFLEVRSGDDQGVAAAENNDRAMVYEALAKKTGSTAEAVGKARARKIAASSAKGVWVQDTRGNWSQK